MGAIFGTDKLTDFTMQLLQSISSKSLIVRYRVSMFHPSKDEIYVNLTVPIEERKWINELIREANQVASDMCG
jgi:hypothetical protein